MGVYQKKLGINSKIKKLEAQKPVYFHFKSAVISSAIITQG